MVHIKRTALRLLVIWSIIICVNYIVSETIHNTSKHGHQVYGTTNHDKHIHDASKKHDTHVHVTSRVNGIHDMLEHDKDVHDTIDHDDHIHERSEHDKYSHDTSKHENQVHETSEHGNHVHDTLKHDNDVHDTIMYNDHKPRPSLPYMSKHSQTLTPVRPSSSGKIKNPEEISTVAHSLSSEGNML